MKLSPEDFEDRFWVKVDKGDPDECWEWQAAVPGNGGYGQFTLVHNNHCRAHRIAWWISEGERPPEDLFVCHECDNKLCVNPNHLWLGTASENMQDCVDKGRICTLKGEERWTSSLTRDEVEQIHDLYNTGEHTQAELGEQFGVSQTSISRLLRGVTWPHVLAERSP